MTMVVLCAFCCFMLGACSRESMDETITHRGPNEAYFKNNPLPVGKHSLKVLAIGNSYTIDATAYLYELLDGMSIPRESYGVYMIHSNAASLESFYSKIVKNEEVQLLRRAGTLEMPCMSGTMRDVISQDWDVVILQQVSYKMLDYSTYNPYLHHMINAVRAWTSNPDVAIVWHMVHTYADQHRLANGESSQSRWNVCCKATRQMMKNDGIDIVIPMGTAIENARSNTRLRDATGLTRDYTHLSFGAARYIAAITWIGVLFDPVYETNIETLRRGHVLTDSELNFNPDYLYIPSSAVAVTEDNRADCINCAVSAIRHPMQVSY